MVRNYPANSSNEVQPPPYSPSKDSKKEAISFDSKTADGTEDRHTANGLVETNYVRPGALRRILDFGCMSKRSVDTYEDDEAPRAIHTYPTENKTPDVLVKQEPKENKQANDPAEPTWDNDYHGQAHLLGRFTASCNKIELHGTCHLTAMCWKIDQSKKYSSICLNEILENEDGYFKWVGHGRFGNFGQSARNVRLEEGGRVLVAELGRIDGTWREDKLLLDAMITNEDGNMKCIIGS
ncbi:CNVH-domain-containing protein [Rhizodiscina lignyota]|uniref:CNVH-domain-containing protein n=1 Tax=Rhizodiscina lignyota TaxID=1504668 RepID=A0A9P4M5A3_9PEZI|nr:CNVH-domain-containing protein [Rhizodiscina lignyota]